MADKFKMAGFAGLVLSLIQVIAQQRRNVLKSDTNIIILILFHKA